MGGKNDKGVIFTSFSVCSCSQSFASCSISCIMISLRASRTTYVISDLYVAYNYSSKILGNLRKSQQMLGPEMEEIKEIDSSNTSRPQLRKYEVVA